MDKKIILYVAVSLLILGLLILTFFPNMIYAINDVGKTGADKCQAPKGYSDQEWKEHMGHHPDIYKECLT